MRYDNIHHATFIDRPNRFIAHLEVDGRVVLAHVKNTGRCRELLIPGCTVYVQHHSNPLRKTEWSLIAVQKGDRCINMDSQAPNRAVEEALHAGLALPGLIGPLTEIRREVSYGGSRLDFYLETATQRAYLEVKGVTLEQDGVGYFPDAPTQRGERHLRELVAARQDGILTYALFLVQMADVLRVEPNRSTDPAFADTMGFAARNGVKLLAYDCHVAPDEMTLRGPVPIAL